MQYEKNKVTISGVVSIVDKEKSRIPTIFSKTIINKHKSGVNLNIGIGLAFPSV